MIKAKVNNRTTFEISENNGKKFINQQELNWDVVRVDANYFHLIYKNKSIRAEIVKADYSSKTFLLKINGQKHEVVLKDKFDLLLESMGFSNTASSEVKEIKAPMPGLILDILVNQGDLVKKGDSLLILEAMKMENVLKSPGDGTVKILKVKKGESVEKNQILIQF